MTNELESACYGYVVSRNMANNLEVELYDANRHKKKNYGLIRELTDLSGEELHTLLDKADELKLGGTGLYKLLERNMRKDKIEDE